MKKLMIISCLLILSVAAQAQFEQGKWIFNPSITGLSLTHSKHEKTTFGFEFLGGAFLVDNAALLLDLGAKWADAGDTYTIGVGGRYYFDLVGIYAGATLKYKRTDFAKKIDDFAICPEVGYAFFINKNVTIEPAVYYDLSLKDSDFSKFGLKFGFGIYF